MRQTKNTLVKKRAMMDDYTFSFTAAMTQRCLCVYQKVARQTVDSNFFFFCSIFFHSKWHLSFASPFIFCPFHSLLLSPSPLLSLYLFITNPPPFLLLVSFFSSCSLPICPFISHLPFLSIPLLPFPFLLHPCFFSPSTTPPPPPSPKVSR